MQGQKLGALVYLIHLLLATGFSGIQQVRAAWKVISSMMPVASAKLVGNWGLQRALQPVCFWPSSMLHHGGA